MTLRIEEDPGSIGREIGKTVPSELAVIGEVEQIGLQGSELRERAGIGLRLQIGFTEQYKRFVRIKRHRSLSPASHYVVEDNLLEGPHAVISTLYGDIG